MVFLIRLIRSALIKSKYNKYFDIKSMTLEDLKWQEGFYSKLKALWLRKCPILFGGKRKKSHRIFSKCEKFQMKIITAGTYENFVLKSIIGFISGVLLTYSFFAFFVLQLKFSLITATYISSIVGCILSLGLAFSSSVRCVVLMLLPQMFSKRGRQALVAYAFILVFTGPAKNTTRNMRILSETMACAQGKLKAAVKSLVDLIRRPFRAIKETVKQLTEKIKIVVDKIKTMINSIKKTIQSIIGVIKGAYNWLNSVVGMCSKKIGTPFERCMKVFDGAIDDCKVKLGPIMNWMCSVAYVASTLCYAVKIFDYICDLIEFVSDGIVDQAKKKLQEFMFQVRNIFYIRIEFSHSFKFSTQQSKSFKEIASGIITEISQRTSAVFSFFDMMSFGFSFFILWMVFQILNYRRKFMTNEAFDNRYITDKIIELDIQRTKLGRETILPLNVHERKKFAPISSIRLVKSEKKVIAKAAIFLALSSLKLSLQILTDYCLYWILTMIRYHGSFETYVDKPSSLEVKVDGKGMLSELYAAVLNAFKPTNVHLDLDPTPCLPDPLPPDFSRYKQIATLMAMAWIICFVEPYGLRLRFVVMSYYHPERAQVRAVWLYNNILRSRGSFLKYARRQLRRKFTKGGEGIEEVSFLDRLRARFPLLRKIWKGKELKACLLCGGLGSKDSPLVKCPRENCIGIYCVDCYATLQNVCTLCKLPIEYGDISDISEERDSSEESQLTKPESKISSHEANAESEESGELDLSDAIHDEDSELSYGYQERERDINEKIDIPRAQKDSEAQKPRDRVTIDDFSPTLSKKERSYSMTLAERTKSGIWALIPDSKSTDLRRRTFMGQLQGDEYPDEGRFSIYPPALLTKMDEVIRRSKVSDYIRRRGGSDRTSYLGAYDEAEDYGSEDDGQFSYSQSRRSGYESHSVFSSRSDEETEEQKDKYFHETRRHDIERDEELEELESNTYSWDSKEKNSFYASEDGSAIEEEVKDPDEQSKERLSKGHDRILRVSSNAVDLAKGSVGHFGNGNSENEKDTHADKKRVSSIKRVSFTNDNMPKNPKITINEERKSSLRSNNETFVQRSSLPSKDGCSKVLTSDVLIQRLSIKYATTSYERDDKRVPPLRSSEAPATSGLLGITKESSGRTLGQDKPLILYRGARTSISQHLKSYEREMSDKVPEKRHSLKRTTSFDRKEEENIQKNSRTGKDLSTYESRSSVSEANEIEGAWKSEFKNAREGNRDYSEPCISNVPASYQLTKNSLKMSLKKERPSFERTTNQALSHLQSSFNNGENKLPPSARHAFSYEIVDKTRKKEGTESRSQPPKTLSESKLRLGYLQKSEVKKEGKMRQRDPEMFERWLSTGKYHCQSSWKEGSHKSSFASKLVQVLNPLNIFYRKESHLDDNIALLPLQKCEYMNKRSKKDSFGEKWRRDEEGRNNLWSKLLFWKKKEKIYNISSSTSTSSGSVMYSRTHKVPTEEKNAERVEKTSFKKLVHQKTSSQAVYDLFKTHKS